MTATSDTTTSENTPPPATVTALPPAGAGPVAAPAAGYVGTLIALLALALGVVALRDGAVSAGWLDGRPFLTSAIGWVDGLGFDWWMIPVGIVLTVVGAWSVLAALRPRRRTAVAVTARSSVWIGPADLARLASRAAEAVPGVIDARSSATLKKITVTARTTTDTPELKAAVTDAVRQAAAITSAPPTVRTRTRLGATR
jgi:hypothetical protein